MTAVVHAPNLVAPDVEMTALAIVRKIVPQDAQMIALVYVPLAVLTLVVETAVEVALRTVVVLVPMNVAKDAQQIVQ